MSGKVFKFFVFAVLAAFLFASSGAAEENFWKEAPEWDRSELSGPDIKRSFAPLAQEAMPAVVTVHTSREVEGGFFFFQQPPKKQQGAGSGFILSSDGYILTNYHVIAKSEEIKVVVGTDQKKEYDAELVGTDKAIDIALIKIDEEGLPVLPLGNSDKLRVGDWVAAIGSPFNFPHTFTVGVVSAKGRRLGLGNYDDFIQTDASINAGNSGGPLINIRGEVVAVNTLIISPTGGNVGIGFATPINMVKMILPQLKKKGEVVRSWLGVSIEPVTGELAEEKGMDEPYGAHVAQVVVGSPADKLGLEVGDVILRFEGEKIQDSGDLPTKVSTFGVGNKATLTWLHEGEKKTDEVLLEKIPSREEMAELKVRGQTSADNALGLGVKEITPEKREKLDMPQDIEGVLVASVAPQSPGAAYGIREGDVIYKINFKNIKNPDDFEKAVSKLGSGDFVRISLWRKGSTILRVFRLP
ncbi:MAG: Do family serine endopeptidase [bacterium]